MKWWIHKRHLINSDRRYRSDHSKHTTIQQQQKLPSLSINAMKSRSLAPLNQSAFVSYDIFAWLIACTSTQQLPIKTCNFVHGSMYMCECLCDGWRKSTYDSYDWNERIVTDSTFYTYSDWKFMRNTHNHVREIQRICDKLYLYLQINRFRLIGIDRGTRDCMTIIINAMWVFYIIHCAI